MNVTVGARSDTGQRFNNEDRIAVLDTDRYKLGADAVLIIADGMGGRASGDQASSFAVDTARQTLVDLLGPNSSASVDIEDASRLLDLASDDPAFVFCSSSGAIIALELLLRHPEQAVKVVAHEPPLVNLLPDALHWCTFFSTVHTTAARSGTAAAMAQFGAELGLDSPQLPPIETLPPHVIEMLTWMKQNNKFFLEHELR